MSSPKISAQEQRNLRNSAKAELGRMEAHLSDHATVQLIDEFKNKFNICETVYKVVLAEHQKRKGKKITKRLRVNMTQVPYALDFAGYSFDKEFLKELFGASSPSSQKGKTVKKLRDAVTHGTDPKAVTEIINRKDELFGYMETFLSVIRTFDATVA